jgi:FdhD protein
MAFVAVTAGVSFRKKRQPFRHYSVWDMLALEQGPAARLRRYSNHMAVASSRRVVRRPVSRLRDALFTETVDSVTAEEPLEIRLIWQTREAVQRKSIAITMRTPGDDFELATGFLFSEGILRARDDLADVSYCLDDDEAQNLNIVNVTLRPGIEFDAFRLERNFFTTSSCGVCGKASLEALEVQGCAPIDNEAFAVDAEVIASLPLRLRTAQDVFEQTGGLHAAGLFDGTGNLLLLREDVGRHNAVDKLIGSRFLDGREDLANTVLALSGRASFELLQKALVARIPFVAAVGAPSSLAVQLAESFNITLAGFVREGGFNIYSGRHRVITKAATA